MNAAECATLGSLEEALSGDSPAAVVIGPLPGGGRNVLAAIRLVRTIHPETVVFYLADALPGILPPGNSDKEVEYLPPLMSGAEIAAAIVEVLRNPRREIDAT
jgi:hypothetical protein